MKDSKKSIVAIARTGEKHRSPERVLQVVLAGVAALGKLVGNSAGKSEEN
ncbi:MAG: hypothetical protein H0U50_07540 [Pyrinomonadaceae bacterium]|nr:hypothetical protein [Pyrinomonadaceae bacterium]